MGDRSIKQRVDQNAITQSIGREKHDIRKNAKHLRVKVQLVPKRSRRKRAPAREHMVIDVGNGLKVGLHPSRYGHKREYDNGVGYESPLDRLPSATDWVEERSHTFEGQYNGDP